MRGKPERRGGGRGAREEEGREADQVGGGAGARLLSGPVLPNQVLGGGLH